jgi:hypothetical protein
LVEPEQRISENDMAKKAPKKPAAPAAKPKRKPGGPGYKATRLQMEERVAAVGDMLAQCWRFSAIKAECRLRYGPLSASMIQIYVHRARVNALKAAATTRPEMIAWSKDFNESVIRDPKATVAEKQKSEQAIRELFGLNAPKQTEISGRDGAPLPAASAPVLIILPDNGRMAKEVT